MRLRSLAYRTDLTFPRFDGSVEDRGNYLVITTPPNPLFYWGNFLLFDAPPTATDLETWPALFAREHPNALHRAFGWDSPDGALGAAQRFVDAGYILDQSLVMTCAQSLPPRKLARSISVRPLPGPDEALNIAADPEDTGGDDSYAEFKRRLRARYRAMVADERGLWLGAFAGERVVGQLGIFRSEDDLVRFQAVETHPDFRRRGVCSTLVSAAQRRGLGELGGKLLVIVCEPDSTAHHVYRDAGFVPVQQQVGLQLNPP